jgi:hypothetical protein
MTSIGGLPSLHKRRQKVIPLSATAERPALQVRHGCEAAFIKAANVKRFFSRVPFSASAAVTVMMAWRR